MMQVLSRIDIEAMLSGRQGADEQALEPLACANALLAIDPLPHLRPLGSAQTVLLDTEKLRSDGSLVIKQVRPLLD